MLDIASISEMGSDGKPAFTPALTDCRAETEARATDSTLAESAPGDVGNAAEEPGKGAMDMNRQCDLHVINQCDCRRDTHAGIEQSSCAWRRP